MAGGQLEYIIMFVLSRPAPPLVEGYLKGEANAGQLGAVVVVGMAVESNCFGLSDRQSMALIAVFMWCRIRVFVSHDNGQQAGPTITRAALRPGSVGVQGEHRALLLDEEFGVPCHDLVVAGSAPPSEATETTSAFVGDGSVDLTVPELGLLRAIAGYGLVDLVVGPVVRSFGEALDRCRRGYCFLETREKKWTKGGWKGEIASPI